MVTYNVDDLCKKVLGGTELTVMGREGKFGGMLVEDRRQDFC